MPVSAQEWAASATIEAAPVIAAAMVLATAISALAARATSTVSTDSGTSLFALSTSERVCDTAVILSLRTRMGLAAADTIRLYSNVCRDR